jgi:hypothetical protein
MKKLLGILIAIALLLVPAVVAAESCCDVCPCDLEACCEAQTNWYAVSYFQKVPTGIFWHGVEMVSSVWTTEMVEAHNRFEAAELLGLRAGYDCFVGSRGAASSWVTDH